MTFTMVGTLVRMMTEDVREFCRTLCNDLCRETALSSLSTAAVAVTLADHSLLQWVIRVASWIGKLGQRVSLDQRTIWKDSQSSSDLLWRQHDKELLGVETFAEHNRAPRLDLAPLILQRCCTILNRHALLDCSNRAPRLCLLHRSVMQSSISESAQ